MLLIQLVANCGAGQPAKTCAYENACAVILGDHCAKNASDNGAYGGPGPGAFTDLRLAIVGAARDDTDSGESD